MNQVVMVGRLVKDPEIKESEDGKAHSNITLAVQRHYKNADGIYETDFVDCVLWDTTASTTAEYCRKGDIIGVKGRLQTSEYENSNGEKRKATQVVAERITFLQSKAKTEEVEKDNSDDMEM